MRSYTRTLSEEQRVYKIRQSRSRIVIENTFGILASRWRIFNTPMNVSVENIERYVKSVKVLHNYLRQTDNALYCPQGFVDCEEMDGIITKGHWRELVYNSPFLTPLSKVHGSRCKGDAVARQDALKEYVNYSEGSLDWQLDYVRWT